MTTRRKGGRKYWANMREEIESLRKELGIVQEWWDAQKWNGLHHQIEYLRKAKRTRAERYLDNIAQGRTE